MSGKNRYLPNSISTGNTENSFADLVKLNQGVLLEPLADTKPVNELGPGLIMDLASLEPGLVKSIITGHTLDPVESSERDFILSRLQEIRGIAKDMSRPTLTNSPSLPSNKAQESSTPPTNKPTIEQTINTLFNESGEPDAEKIPEVIEEHFADPRVIAAIDKAYVDSGHSLDEAGLSTISAVRKNVIGAYQLLSPEIEKIGSSRLLYSWIKGVGDVQTSYATGLYIAVLELIVENSPALVRTPQSTLACIKVNRAALKDCSLSIAGKLFLSKRISLSLARRVQMSHGESAQGFNNILNVGLDKETAV